MSFFSKAKDKLNVSRSNSLRSKTGKDKGDKHDKSRDNDKDKDKDKKRLSGLRYDSKYASSKESVNSLGSKGKKKDKKKVKDIAGSGSSGKEVISQGNEVINDVNKDITNSIDGVTDTTKEASNDVRQGIDLVKHATEEVSNAVTKDNVTKSIDLIKDASKDASEDTNKDTNKVIDDSKVAVDDVVQGIEPLSDTKQSSTTSIPNKIDPIVKLQVPIEGQSPSNDEPTETTPMLNNNLDLESQRNQPVPTTTSILSSPSFTISVIVVLLLLVSIVYFTYSESNVVIKQSVHPILNSFEILNLHDQGVDLTINSSIIINYDNITNHYSRFLYNWGSFIIGGITLIPHLPIEVALNDLDSFNISTPPQFELNLINHAVNNFEFNSTVKLNDKNLIKLLNDLMSQDEAMVNIKSNFTTGIKKNWFQLNNIPITIDQDLIIDNNINFQNLNSNIVDFTIAKDFSFTGKFNLGMPLIEQILNDSITKFSILINDCNKKFHPIGVFSVNDSVVKGQLLPFPHDDCKLLNDLVSSYLDHYSKLFISSDIQNPQLPSWMLNIINNVICKLPLMQVPLPNLDLDYTLQYTDIDVEHGIMQNNISVDLPWEFDIDYEIINIGTGSAHYHNDNFINYLDIKDIINNDYNGFDNVKGYDLRIDKLDILSPIINSSLNFEIYNISLPQALSIPDTEINVMDVLVVDASNDSLILLVDADIVNVSYNFPKPLEINTNIGNISVSDRIKLSLTKNPSTIEMLNNIISNKPTLVNLTLNGNVPPFNIIEGLQISTTPVLNLSNELIIDSSIHVFGSQAELTVFNPVSNHEVGIVIHSVDASYQGARLGELAKQEHIVIVPGVSKTPKLPIKLNPVGLDILKRAMNEELLVDVVLEFIIIIDNLQLPLVYQGTGLKTSIKW